MENVNKKILLVEDDLNFGAVLKDYLMLNDFDVVLAKNGMEGFEKFKKDNYDLCILDVMMPYKDGYTLAKEIREISEGDSQSRCRSANHLFNRKNDERRCNERL